MISVRRNIQALAEQMGESLGRTRAARVRVAAQPLGEGGRSIAYPVEIPPRSDDDWDRFEVLKVVKPHRDASSGKANAEFGLMSRATAAKTVVKATCALRASSRFRERFGDIVPETRSPFPGVILQERGRGVRLDALGPRQREAARAEVRAAHQLAQSILPEVLFSQARGNFLFDEATGRITSWFDVVADSRGTYEAAGRPFPFTGHAEDNQGERIAGYEILQELGKGADGTVYLAMSPVGLPVALKVSEKVQKVGREAELMAQLGASRPDSHVVHLLEHFTLSTTASMPERTVLVMEAAGSAIGRFGGTTPRSPTFAVQAAIEMARGARTLHASGLLHRDIHPGNVLIEGDDPRTVRLADVGNGVQAPRHTAASVPAARKFQSFRAPEAFAREGRVLVDARSDVFSIGAMLYYLLKGHAPFGVDGRELEQAQQVFEQGADVDGLPAPVAAVLERALAYDPAQRQSSAHELLQELKVCLAQLSEGAKLDWSAVEPAPLVSLIQAVYLSELDRPPDAPGLAHYVTKMHRWRVEGASDETLRGRLVEELRNSRERRGLQPPPPLEWQLPELGPA